MLPVSGGCRGWTGTIFVIFLLGSSVLSCFCRSVDVTKQQPAFKTHTTPRSATRGSINFLLFLNRLLFPFSTSVDYPNAILRCWDFRKVLKEKLGGNPNGLFLEPFEHVRAKKVSVSRKLSLKSALCVSAFGPLPHGTRKEY